jgi:hypothetical protein
MGARRIVSEPTTPSTIAASAAISRPERGTCAML